MQWTLDASAWWLLPLLFLAAAFTWLLYRKHPFRRDDGSSPRVVWLMALLRFTALFLVLLLLLSPVIRLRRNQVEQPLLLVFTDRSQSLGALPDSAAIVEWYQNQLPEHAAQVFGRESVQIIPFGCGISGESKGLDQDCTDFERAFREAADRFAGRHIGAVVVVSDGIAGSGLNPAYLNPPFRAPLYTLGLGDTAVKKDLLVRKAEAPRVVFMGNEFSVEADISASGFSGVPVQVTLQEQGQTVATQTLILSGNPPYARVRFPVQAGAPGLRQFKVVLKPLDGEWTLRNNSVGVLTEVVDERQKIALVYAAPHPDIAAFKAAVAEAPAFELGTFDLNAFRGKALESYDLIIWHQLPGIRADAADLIERADKAGVNMLFVLGGSSNTDLLARRDPAFRITLSGGRTTEAQGLWNGAFSGFAAEAGWEDALNNLPPMQVPFGSYVRGAGLEVLAWQKIGSVSTANPLIAFSSKGQAKTGYIAGDGWWRWRMHHYTRNNSHELLDRLLLRIVRYCAVRGNRKLFRVEPQKQVFSTEEYAVFDGVLLDRSMTPVAGRQIKVQLEGASGFRKELMMSPSGSGYRLEAGNLPAGTYRFTASVEGMPGKMTSGSFVMVEQQREWQQLQADWQALRQLARNNGGLFAPAAGDKELFARIKSRNQIQPLLRSEITAIEATDAWWYLFAVLLLLSSEWILRRVYGAY